MSSRSLSLMSSIAFASFFALATGVSYAEDEKTYEVTLKGDVLEPAEIHVPKDTPFIIKFTNTNDAPAELEAKELRIEKIAAGKSDIVVRVKGMPAGKYLFVDEFQEDVAKGYVIAE